MFGRVHGYDVYGQPDFKNTEVIGELPRCLSKRPGGMPIKLAPAFRKMSKEGFLRGRKSISVRSEPKPTDESQAAGRQEERPGD